jgi:hypothetical protein
MRPRIEVQDPYGTWAVVKCPRGGWALWRYSNERRAWVGDPPSKGPFRTQREALIEVRARAEDAFTVRELWQRLSEQRDEEGRREVARAWLLWKPCGHWEDSHAV